MTDSEKCRMIAEFEGWHRVLKFGVFLWEHPTDESLYSAPPDYEKSLDATMRAARRLPEGICLELLLRSDMGCNVTIMKINGLVDAEHLTMSSNPDPARAAFEALAAYLEKTITPA